MEPIIKNVCLYAGYNLWGPIIDQLKNEGYWQNVMWISKNPNANYQVDDSYMANINHDRYKGYGQSIYNEVYKEIYKFTDMYSRNSPWGQDIYNPKTIHDILNIFNRLFDYYTYNLIYNKIQLLIMPRAPHNGHDFLLYKISECLGIKTLILEQSLFPNKFFYYYKNEDYGIFKDVKSISTIRPYKIEKSHDKDFFYMKSPKKSYNLIALLKRFYKWYNKNPEIKLLKHLLSKTARGQAIFRYQIEKEYKRNMKSIITQSFKLNVKYVYFPLHLQPEKTTSNWGGIYNDQILAIEYLSKFIPGDWFIYVKENPKQGAFMRGPWFFKRLNALRNVFVVPTITNTVDLITNSQFVSTISGSVGWEAISGGKNVLVFGNTWYLSLPGVFKFSNELTIKEILNYKIVHKELEMQLGILYSKMGNGIVYKYYDKIYQEYDPIKNIESIVSFIKRVLYTGD